MKIKITKYKNDIKRIGDIVECVIIRGVKTKKRNTKRKPKYATIEMFNELNDKINLILKHLKLG
jgi:hypothetical protein